jgi:hypothetical protein
MEGGQVDWKVIKYNGKRILRQSSSARDEDPHKNAALLQIR